MYSESLPTIETMKTISNKNIIRTFIKHEYEQIRHIDSDVDGIRNMKITQDFYDSLEKLNSNHQINIKMMIMLLYLICIRLSIISHQKLKIIISINKLNFR